MVARLPDFGLLTTVEVTVNRPVAGEPDPFGEPTYSTSAETVAGVLPYPSATSDLGADRPEGTSASMTFHFPAGYGKPLNGCTIVYGGEVYRVIGEPLPTLEEITPGPFSLVVETERIDG